jgi:hypothetical protein
MRLSNSDILLLLLTWVGGIVFLLKGMKAAKTEAKKQSGVLYKLLAGCMFTILALDIVRFSLKPDHFWVHAISVTQLIVAGMLLGICLVMQILGY